MIQHLATDGGDVAALSEIYRVLRPGGYLLVRANSRLGMWQEKGDRDADFQRYTLPEVVSRLGAAGFDVRRSTYANALPALYASLRQWTRRRKRGHAHDQHHQPHQEHRLYDGLRTEDRTLGRPWLNRTLLWILRAEALYLSKAGRSLGFGHTTFCLGQRPRDQRAAGRRER